MKPLSPRKPVVIDRIKAVITIDVKSSGGKQSLVFDVESVKDIKGGLSGLPDKVKEMCEDKVAFLAHAAGC